MGNALGIYMPALLISYPLITKLIFLVVRMSLNFYQWGTLACNCACYVYDKYIVVDTITL